MIVSFAYCSPGSPYDRMASVFEHSSKRHNRAETTVHRCPPCPDRSAAFSRKARDWARTINESRLPRLALFDADMFFQAPISSVWKWPFDIAVTTDIVEPHRGFRGSLNSGALFVRPSPKVAAFFEPWGRLTDKWCRRNSPPHVIRFGDQDALAQMLASCELDVLSLPLHEWNSTQRTWHLGLDLARVVHFKSRAREHVFDGAETHNLHVLEVANRWRALEKEINDAS